MKRIIVICEGQTEQEFCKDILVNHFAHRNIILQYPTIKHNGGGIVEWSILKRQIELHLRQDSAAYVTTFIDLYGLYQHHGFPSWERCVRNVDVLEKVRCLEASMSADIDANLSARFIPYIQIHEYEALLFVDADIYRRNFTTKELLDIDELERLIKSHPNPEYINNSRETAPSKRLKRLVHGYDKVVYGSLIAQEIGLANIRAKCLKFNSWLQILES